MAKKLLNVIALRNYLSVFRGRLEKKEEITSEELSKFLIECDFYFGEMEQEINQLETRVGILEKSNKTPSNKSNGSFVDVILSKIQILKNILQEKMETGDEQMFSLNWVTVEEIEKEIKETNTVTKYNLEKLNKIYISEKNQI